MKGIKLTFSEVSENHKSAPSKIGLSGDWAHLTPKMLIKHTRTQTMAVYMGMWLD